MIRNIFRYAVLSITALLLASCVAGTLVDSPTGSISFAFPKGTLSRGIDEETYKVVIYYGLDRYEAEPAVSGDELTFADIPTGEVRIIVARGTEGTDGFFYSDSYGQLFITIVPGDNGPYDLDLGASEFVRADSLKGKDVNGLAVLGGTFYASAESSLGSGEFSLASGEFVSNAFSMTDSADLPEVPDGVAVNSISIGKVYEAGKSEPKPRVWVNGTWSEATGGGIMPWLPGPPDTLDKDFSAGFGNPTYREDGVLSDVSVEYSGAFKVPDADKDALAILFQRDGGMGGVYLTSGEFETNTFEWPWIVDEIDFDELLSDVVSEGSEFIRDFAVSPGASGAYVVTSLVTMKVSETVASGEQTFASPNDILSSNSIAYAPYLGSDVVSIGLGGVYDDEIVYLGTKNGLYAGPASTDADEFFAGEASLVAGTAGYYIEMVASSPDGALVAFAARRGDNPDLLIIVNTETDDVVDFRGLQGLPGTRLSNLVWLNNDELVVSGDHGLAAIDAAALF